MKTVGSRPARCFGRLGRARRRGFSGERLRAEDGVALPSQLQADHGASPVDASSADLSDAPDAMRSSS